MHKRTFSIIQMALVWLAVASMVLVGCGGKATPKATPTPQVEATAAQPEASSAGGEGQSQMENSLDNLLQLAPVHFTSAFSYKKGNEITGKAELEGDVDARGNEHLFITDQSGKKIELYLVDGKLYIKSESDKDFMMLSDMPQDSAFSFLAIYGGAYLLGFNQLEAAQQVGVETVNGFEAVKYAIKQSNASFGLNSSLVGAANGVKWDYQGFMWVEPQSRAMVRATVEWTAESKGQKESYQSEFNATRSAESAILAPLNVITATAAEPAPPVQEGEVAGEPTPPPLEEGAPPEPAEETKAPVDTPVTEPTSPAEPTAAYPG